MLADPTVARRALLGALAAGLAPRPRPALASDTARLQQLAASVRGSGDAGLTAWGEPWSKTCSWQATPDFTMPTDEVPAWLVGRWRVTSSIDGASFPIGRKYISQTLPGVRMASILLLPNVGNEPTFDVEYSRDRERDRLTNTVTTLEAFWPKARVVDADSPRPGQIVLRYEGPTLSKSKVAQSVNLQLCSLESGATAEDEWTLAEVYQQDNVEQGTRGEYEVISNLRRTGPDAVTVRQRVAAFLQPTDGQYTAGAGKPVALYDYTFRYSRIA